MNSPQSSQNFQQLRSLLQLQTEHVSSYIDYLQLIKNAVAQNQVEELNQLLAESPDRIEPIETLQNQQAEIIQRHGYQPDDAGLQDLIKQYDQQGQLDQLKKELSEKLKQLEKSLLINDLLIRKNQDRVRQSIRILSGHSNTDHGMTYSRQGNTSQADNDKHSIALA